LAEGQQQIQIPITAHIGGWGNGGSEIVKTWKDYFHRILKSENYDNESAEFVEQSINCKNYLGLEVPMYSIVSLTPLL